VVFFLLFVTKALADSDWYTRAWQTDDGLPNNYVTGITQGRDGYLWVATKVGLMRFDGVHFSSFQFNQESPGVRTLSNETSGRTWIIPYRGPILAMDQAFDLTPLAVPGLPRERPTTIVEDRDRALWIAYQDQLWRVKDGQAKPFGSSDGLPGAGGFNALLRDNNGTIWYGRGGSVACLKGDHFDTIGRYARVRLAPDGTNGVFVQGNGYLYRCSTNGNPPQLVGQFLPETAHADAGALMVDHTGAVWIGTANYGLFRYDGLRFQKIETSHPSISCLCEDREGNIWAGTDGGGLDRISRRGIRLEMLEDASSTPSPILSICEDSRGMLWGATQNGNLVRRVGDKWLAMWTNNSMANIVTCVAPDRKGGGIWIGCRTPKMYHLSKNETTFWDATTGYEGRMALGMFTTSMGDLWIAEFRSPHLLQCLRNGEWVPLDIPKTFTGRVSAIVEDAGGDVWFGSSAGNLLRARGNTLTDESGILYSNQAILSLYATVDGAVWIGFDGGGLARLKDGKLARVRVDVGLLDNHISQIIADDKGWFWFGSGRGIFKVRREKLEEALEGKIPAIQSVHYGPNEGLSSVEGNSVNADPYIIPAAIRSRDGHLWIPARTGLASITPRTLEEKQTDTPVLLTDVTMDGQSFASYGGMTNPSVINLRTLKTAVTVPARHHRLQFKFAALNFSTPENIHIQYRLKGLDPDWIDASPDREAAYSRLDAGDYQFNIRVRNGDSEWVQTDSPLAFTVVHFFWQTWWFRLFIIILFTSLVAAVVRYVSFRRLRLKVQALEREAALNRERARIARDLHDDLGGHLTQVKQLFELTSRHRGSPEQVNEFVQRGLTVARRGVKSLDETVWAVNPRNDALPNLINYIGQRAVEFLSTAGLQYHLELPDHPPEVLISAEVRHNLFYVVKEALNNVVTHANAKEVWLIINTTDKGLNIVVQDDGQGFGQLEDSATSDGLRNMQSRMETIKGGFVIESGPGAGTKITCTYFWQ